MCNNTMELANKAQAERDKLYKKARGSLIQHNKIVIQAGTGVGKALRNSEPVLTPEGWKLISNLTLEDKVIGSDGKAKSLLGIYPQEGKRDIYRISFSDGSHVECDKEHLWEVSNKKGKVSVKSVKELLELRLYSDRKDSRYNTVQRQYYYSVKLVKPIEFPKKELPVDPYLLGVLLGDGSFRSKTITVTLNNKFNLSKLLLPEDVSLSLLDERENCKTYSLIDKNATFQKANVLTAAIEELGLMGKLSTEKYIPEKYLTASVEDRESLLQGLLDTDGHNLKGKRNLWEYSSSSKELAAGVRDLVRSLGIQAKLTVKKAPTYTHNGEKRIGKPSYRVYLNYKKRKKAIVGIELISEDYATCIKVDSEDSLFVTRDYTLTHNTKLGLDLIDDNQDGSTSWHVLCPTQDIVDGWYAEIEKHDMKHLLAEGMLSIYCYQSIHKKGVINANYIFDEAHNMTERRAELLEPYIKDWTKIIGLSAKVPLGKRLILDKLGFSRDNYLNFTTDDAVEAGIIVDYDINAYKVPMDGVTKYHLPRFKKPITEVAAYNWLTSKINDFKFRGDFKGAGMFGVWRKQVMSAFPSKEKAAMRLISQVPADKQALVFAANIKQSDRLSEHSYHSKSVKDLLNRYRAREFNVLSSVGKLVEGVNCPCDIIIKLGVDKNDIRLIQSLGRSLRIDPDNPDKRAMAQLLVSEETVEEKWLSTNAEQFKNFSWKTLN